MLWERLWDLEGGYDSEGTMIKPVSVQEASNVITELNGLINQAKRNKPQQLVLPTVKPGIYNFNGEIYKVQYNIPKTNVYALKMVQFGGNRLTEGGEVVHFKWEWAPGVVKQLTPNQMLNKDQVGELGLRYGQCIVCGRTLVDAFSVQRGIGPVCYQNYGG